MSLRSLCALFNIASVPIGLRNHAKEIVRVVATEASSTLVLTWCFTLLMELAVRSSACVRDAVAVLQPIGSKHIYTV